MKRKIAFKTLGCRLNQYETDAIASQFTKGNDFDVVPFDQEADVYVINTCTVTNQSDQRSRNMINHAAKRKDDSVIIVTGCMANNQSSILESRNKYTYLVDNKRKSSIYPIVKQHFDKGNVDINSYTKDVFSYQPAEETFHTRSLIKIQDGCDNFCSFCIIPDVRGKAISRPVNKILDNIKQVIDFGFKEIVLTGVNIGRYDYNGSSFEDLVEQVLNIDGDFRVRISSIEPEGFGDKLFDLFNHPKLCPHLHLCLQSGSDKILLQMRRMYTTKSYMEMVEKIKTQYPLFNLTTDIIVGFPGETTSDFEETCKIARDVNFSHIHTFRYSIREGTRAARMKDQIPENIKIQRSEVIRQISLDNKKRYYQSMIGQKQTILSEGVSKNGMIHGYGEHYIPIETNLDTIEKNIFVPLVVNEVIDLEEPYLKGE
ncbi:MAG: tRNA (N(6)-L-threonylcarbamoyladenosine(37)-C(2))-methylthiotransferase MtaB [Hyphomicrobiales bacterium]